MTSQIKSLIRANQSSLVQERAGLPSLRKTARDIATINQPSTTPVVGPVAITSDVKSGAALNDALGVMHDAGLIDNQSTQGTTPIVPLSDSATALDAITSAGIVVRTGPGSYVTRSIQFVASLNPLGILNADGVAGNPRVYLGPLLWTLHTLESATGVLFLTGSGSADENGGTVPVQGRSATSASAPNASTSTWATAITVSVNDGSGNVLPAGTWKCLATFDARVQHSAGGKADLRIVVNGSASATLTEAFANRNPGDAMAHSTVVSGIVSDGTTQIDVTGQYRANAAGTVTLTGVRLVLQYFRTA